MALCQGVRTSEHEACSAAACSIPRQPTETKWNIKTRRRTCFDWDQTEVYVNPAQDVCNKYPVIETRRHEASWRTSKVCSCSFCYCTIFTVLLCTFMFRLFCVIIY